MTLKTQHSPKCRDGFFRRVVGYVAVLALALQVMFPGIAKATPVENWIEICGEFGVTEIEVAAEKTDSQNKDCPDCDNCLMCTAENGQARKNMIPSTHLNLTIEQSQHLYSATLASNPAQFWHDGRGPPRLNTYNMTRVCSASMASTLSKEVASWI